MLNKMRKFSYHKPKSIKEAVDLLNKYGESAKILAGGTDLLVELKKRQKTLSHLIDIKGIPFLDRIVLDSQGYLRVGPLATIQTISTSPTIVNRSNVLSKAASKIGSLQIRNRATIGGNVCRASPSGDTLPALLCLNAKLKLEGLLGKRIVPIEKFFLGPGESVSKIDEILTEILIPPLLDKSYGVYKKLTLRRAMDLSVVGIAISGSFDSLEDRFRDIRIGLCAVAPIPFRAKKAENILTSMKINKNLIEEAAYTASLEAKPISDIRGSEWYRKDMIKCLIEEGFRKFWLKIERYMTKIWEQMK